VDVETGPRHQVYALSQGQWDGVMEGSPALPDTGRLERVTAVGSLTPLLDGDGQPIVLDRPTSVEFIGRTGFVVSLTGAISMVTGL
jgi:hypothetical protein